MRLLLEYGACLKSVSGHEAMTPLHFAAMEGTPASVGLLIEKGLNKESKCRRGCTPLHLAAESGNTDTARALLGFGADISSRSNNGGTVLSWSSCNDHVETMKLWLSNGAQIDARDRNGLTSLFVASHFGCINALKLLLERGADTKITSIKPDGFSVIIAGAVSNHPEVIQVLTDHGCDISLRNGAGETALDLAFNHRNKEAVQVLLELTSPGSFHPKDSVALQMAMAKSHDEMAAFVSVATLMYPYVGFKFETPGEFAWMEWVLNEGGKLVKPWAMRKLLHIALDEANILMLKALQSHGCDFNSRLESGLSPLALCVRTRQRHMTEILLNGGANPNQRSSKDHFRTVFDDAIVGMKDEYDTEYVHLLLDTGCCRLNKGTNPASTAFAYVLSKIDKWSPGSAMSLAKRMLTSRALRNTTSIDEDRDSLNCTMLHAAVLGESEEMVHHLLDAGRAPLHLATEYNLPESTLTLLKSHDVSTEDIDEDTWTPLCCCNTPEVALILLDHGANVNYGDKDNWTPLHQAVHKREVDLVELLLSAGADVNVRTTDDGLTVEERMRHLDDVRDRPIFGPIIRKIAIQRQRPVRDYEDDDIEIVDRAEEIS
ncbi:ankyrin [Lophiostoma macrostomum CBS 122681]|uniref:Ankyrin n=1 Tax=Lophiostoma macrostomum CBS 122681 TaxID=1314788 RepID=A0A6A6TCB8_9PLEO|nr:ankyrin [Lophiostoma macrostomum CBS 122681]